MERYKQGGKRVVVCAANRSIVTGKIICGARHWDTIMRGQVEWLKDHPTGRKMPDEWVECESGFIDQKGIFLTRQEAFVIAYHAGQITEETYKTGSPNYLFSEDLY